MSLGVCECEEHLVAEPVDGRQKIIQELDAGCGNDSKAMIKPCEVKDTKGMDALGPSDNVEASLQESKCNPATSSASLKSRPCEVKDTKGMDALGPSDNVEASLQESKCNSATSSASLKSRGEREGFLHPENTELSDHGKSSPLFKMLPSTAETNGLECKTPADLIPDTDTDQPAQCITPKAVRIPVEQSQDSPCTKVHEVEGKLDASPEVTGIRRKRIGGAIPGSVHASRISVSARKGKEHTGQAGRVLKGNMDSAAGVNPSPRSVRASRRVPLGWFPRGQKTESYLERKIRMLQQTEGGKIASLDETLGASNVHLSRIEREKQAAQAAAVAAIEARKVALVEASWCRILKATGIPFMEAALELQKAEMAAAEALAAATALGVILGHNPRSPRFGTETESNSGAHDNISAALETAFDVDKAVAAALKTALLRHTMDLKDADLQRAMALITTPQVVQSTGQREWVDGASTEVQGDSEQNSVNVSEHGENSADISPIGAVAIDGSSQENPLLENMLRRVRGLQPEECTSMATIVATRGLGALLQEENLEQENSLKAEGGGSLGDVLVKHVSRLEAEKSAAKTAGEGGRAEMKRRLTVSVLNPVTDFGNMFVKHVSRLEREKKAAIEAAAKEAETWVPGETVKFDGHGSQSEGLDNIFVKKMSRLEKEKAAANGRRRSSIKLFSPRKGRRVSLTRRPSLGESLIKHKSRLEKEIETAKARRLSTTGKSMKKSGSPPKNIKNEMASLGDVLVKHMSKLEREKEAAKLAAQAVASTLQSTSSQSESQVEPVCKADAGSQNAHEIKSTAGATYSPVQPSLADLGARKLSKIEMEKQVAASAASSDNGNPWEKKRPSFKSRGDTSEIWAGVGLGATLIRHVSKLELEQAAWRNAEEMASAH